MGENKIIVVAKIFNKRGSLAYICKTANEARCLPGTLEAIRQKDVQIVVLTDPDIYAEYAPYEYIDGMKEFIDKVTELNNNAVV